MANHVENHGVNNSRKLQKLKNISSNSEAIDLLCNKQVLDVPCTSQVCMGSVMGLMGKGAKVRTPEEIMKYAKDFLLEYYTSIKRLNTPAHNSRLEQVQKELDATGTYQLTETELIYGAKLAWRNTGRCIGRIQWSRLQVFDCRSVTTTSGMFEALCNHMKYGTNKGNIRSAITIFPQKTDDKHDYRVWNNLLLSYAGYKQPDGSVIGDPGNVEFTDLCINLGWKSPRTKFDILPLVLQANGHDPEYFDIPKELVMEVPLTHPTFEWFADFGLKWYALPAVSNMFLDCGGLQFTGVPFNGWYMSTEIGCRNLCDPHRYNMLETVALAMGLDTRSPISLWKDKAMVECNVAVLHSFQEMGVTIVDHHTASETFMKHLENEQRLRNGCPADWVWIVPPLSGSATPVFHQEMALYTLMPHYDYQDPPWRNHVWRNKSDGATGLKKKPRKFHFKQIARAVKFASKLFGKALSRRIKATVLYATETGKSEGYAKKLGEILGHAFNAQVYSMSEYDVGNLEHEALLLIVASTFGNGDPPENGEEFAKNLHALKMNEMNAHNSHNDTKLNMTSKSFIKANSQIDMQTSKKALDRIGSMRASESESLLEDNFGPLSNVRFAVFALGSSAYPNFCAFGQYVDNLLGELGGERLLKVVHGDEMGGQDQAFKKWAPEVFKIACETFCLDDNFQDATNTLKTESLTSATVRFVKAEPQNIRQALTKIHNKNVCSSRLVERQDLHHQERSTLKLVFESDLVYTPGDHIGVFAWNRPELVTKILSRLTGINQSQEEIIQLQVQKESHTATGVVKTWHPHEKIPPCSARELFTKFLDITTPPQPNLLQYFASIATDDEDRKKLHILTSEPTAYEDWRYSRFPHLLEVLEEFPSVHPYAPLLVVQLSLLQPRFYSVSSCRDIYPGQMHLTVAVVTYRTQNGTGPIHYGVCSNFLQDVPVGEYVNLFVRKAPNFYLPSDSELPIVLVSPGTGVAPFRAFWNQRLSLYNRNIKLGRCWLFFGCRIRDMDLYREEKQEMVKKGVLEKVFLALSREPNIKKTYVQDLVIKESEEIYNILVKQKGHFYVCGDVTMAEHVFQTLKTIIQTQGNMTDTDAENFMLKLRDENRYHEDVFGITLRTAEVHSRSRKSARIRMESEP